MQRSVISYFFLALAAVLALTALVLLLRGPHRMSPAYAPQPVPRSDSTQPPTESPPTDEPSNPPAAPAKTAPPATRPATATDPADLAKRVAKALESGDPAALERLLGPNALDPESAARLKALSADGGLRLRPVEGVREVGELEINSRSRWALELENPQPGQDRIVLDLRRDSDKWLVEKITLPPAPTEPGAMAEQADSLGVADAFVQATLKQDFESARVFADPATVSDAKIAALCILFEDGGYLLRKSKPLRAMFEHQDTAGFLATVETTDGKQAAQFSLALKQAPAPATWRVTEINLDQLLADYANRVAGGDIYYSPLVKNPAGGDTIALYFEFDQDAINPRTRHQLDVVAHILKADPGKKLTLSGHTDALGTEPYNDKLSARRAGVVRDFLIQAGVAASQITTVAKGASQPRRPNVTSTGQDNPEGRRANRRTEVYLDF